MNATRLLFQFAFVRLIIDNKWEMTSGLVEQLSYSCMISLFWQPCGATPCYHPTATPITIHLQSFGIDSLSSWRGEENNKQQNSSKRSIWIFVRSLACRAIKIRFSRKLTTLWLSIAFLQNSSCHESRGYLVFQRFATETLMNGPYKNVESNWIREINDQLFNE